MKNDGLPIAVSGAEKPTYKILGVYADDTLYLAYTNPNGQIAYKADGSPFTESDIPETWPATWQTSWKINLSTVFRENQERIQKVDKDVDYTLSSCKTTIKTPRGLRYLSNIPNTCSSPTIILETDLDFGGDGTESCENNWDTTYTLIKGTLQGNGHTISGICYKTTDQKKTALFNLGATSDSVSILNVKFKDIYIKDSHTNSDSVYTSVFFPNTKTKILVKDVTFDNITVESELGSAKGNTGIVFGRNWATRHTIQNTTIKNSNIRVDRPAYVGSLIARTDSIFTAKNNSIDVNIIHNVTPSTNSYTISYTGAVAGYLRNRYTLTNNHIYGKIELNSTTAYTTIYAAGLVANTYSTPYSVQSDTVEVDIQLNLTKCNNLYAGGFFGSTGSGGKFSNLSYIGSIRGNVNGSHYIGGITGSAYVDTLNSVSVTGKNGASDTIISITTTKTTTPYYSGGLMGFVAYAAPIKNATVRGVIKGAQIGAGFASVEGNVSSDCVTDISGLSYIGKLIPSYNSSSAFGNVKSGVRINLKDSYAIDLGGKTTNLWTIPSQTANVAYGTSTDALAYIQDAGKTRDSAYSKTPAFAYKLNMAYEADQYDRFAYGATEPTHLILGISGKDTLYRGYTNAQGYLAYKEDGSPFTESDLPAPDAWPANWSEEDKVNLTTAYHEDFIRMNIFTDTDRTIDKEKCIVNIKSANALQNLSLIRVPECSVITYKLSNNIIVDANKISTGCTTNWDNTYANVQDTLDGNGFSVSGICLNTEESPDSYIFKATGPLVVKNISFNNIYITTDQKASKTPSKTSLFANNNTGSLSFTNINLDDISIKGTQYNGMTGALVSYVNSPINLLSIQAKNIDINVTNAMEIGGLIGTVDSVSVYAKDIDFEGSISATHTDSTAMGSIIGSIRNGKSISDLSYIHAKAPISGTSKKTCMGGIIGYREFKTYKRETETFHHINYEGNLSYNTSNYSSYSYIGGLIGYYYSLSQYYSLVLQDISAKSAEGSKGILISRITPAETYASGLIGRILASSVSVEKAVVLGGFENQSTNKNYTFSGILNIYSATTTINNSFFVGNLPNDDNKNVFGLLYDGSSTFTASNSYGVNLGEKSILPCNKASSQTLIGSGFAGAGVTVTDKGNIIGTAAPQSPALANLMKFTYNPDEYEGHPRPLSGTELPTYHLKGVYGSNVLYDAYTDTNGKIAYKADGSPFTSTDIPTKWPSIWEESWKINLAKTYTKDEIYDFSLTEDDYDATKCPIVIKTANGLMNISKLPTASCGGKPQYELANDINLGGDGSSNCESNWNNQNAKFNGTLDGKGHTITGLCIQEPYSQNIYAFDIEGEANVKNLKFQNTYVAGNSTSAGGNSFRISLFATGTDTTGKTSFSDILFDNIKIHTTRSMDTVYAGVLLNKTYYSVSINNVKATNVDIDVGAQKLYYAGGFIGYVQNTVISNKNKISGSMNTTVEKTGNSSYVGGMYGRSYRDYYVSSGSYLIYLDSKLDSISMNISISNGSAYAGGFAGRLDLGSGSAIKKLVNLEYPSYSGTISIRSGYAGGLIGYGSADTTNILGANVSSPLGYNGDLIQANTASYSAGLIGYANGFNNVRQSSVLGNISIATKSTSYRINGLMNTSSIIEQSRYVGTLSNTGSAWGLCNSSRFIMQSYAIDLGNFATRASTIDTAENIVGLGNSLTDSLNIITKQKVIDRLSPASPKFANLFGFAYAPTESDKLPRPAQNNEQPTYRVAAIYKGAVIYEGYTDVNGKLAYKADGTSFTSKDIPTTWPEGFPEAWKIKLSDVFNENTVRIQNLDTEDVEPTIVDGENVIVLKSARALQEISTISTEGVSYFELGNDIVVSSTPMDQSCATNWDNATANLNIALKGNGHKISGICINNEDQSNTYILKLNKGNSIENVVFDNIYMNASNTLEYSVGILDATEAQKINVTDVTVNNVTIEGGSTSSIGNYGLLLGEASNDVEMTGIKVTNSKIILTKNSNAGALIGKSAGHITIRNSDVSASISATAIGKYGGLVGYQKVISVPTKPAPPYTYTAMPRYAPSANESYDLVYDGNNVGVDIDVKTSSYEGSYMGGILGFMEESTLKLTNNIVETTISLSDQFEFHVRSYIGGLLGACDSYLESNKIYSENNKFIGKLNNIALGMNGYTGGIVGLAYADFISLNDTVDARIESVGQIGGIIAASNKSGIDNTTIQNSYFEGLISGDARTVGGLIGLGSATISNSRVRAKGGSSDIVINVSPSQSITVGGLIGSSGAATIDNGSSVVGGITIANENAATLSSINVGGIAGSVDNATIKNIFYIGDIDIGYASANAYGIGYTNGTSSVENSFALVTNGKVQQAWNKNTQQSRVGIGSASDVVAKIYTGSSTQPVGLAYPKSPKFAYLLETFSYGVGANEGYPFYDERYEPTHIVAWVMDNTVTGKQDTISQLFTDYNGIIAYNLEGQAVQESDFPPEEHDLYYKYPAKWEKPQQANSYNSNMAFVAPVKPFIRWFDEDGNRIDLVDVNADNNSGTLEDGTEINENIAQLLPNAQMTYDESKQELTYTYWTNVHDGSVLNTQQIVWDQNYFSEVFGLMTEPVKLYQHSITVSVPKFMIESGNLYHEIKDMENTYWDGDSFDFTSSNKLPQLIQGSTNYGFRYGNQWYLELYDGTNTEKTSAFSSAYDFRRALVEAYTQTSLQMDKINSRLVFDGTTKNYSTELAYTNMSDQTITVTIDSLDLDIDIEIKQNESTQQIYLPLAKKISFDNAERIRVQNNLDQKLYAKNASISFEKAPQYLEIASYITPKITVENLDKIFYYENDSKDPKNNFKNGFNYNEDSFTLYLHEFASLEGCFDTWEITHKVSGTPKTNHIYEFDFPYAYKLPINFSGDITISPVFSDTECNVDVNLVYAADPSSSTPITPIPEDLKWEVSFKGTPLQVNKLTDHHTVSVPRTESPIFDVKATSSEKLLLRLADETNGYNYSIANNKFNAANSNVTIYAFPEEEFKNKANTTVWVDADDKKLFELRHLNDRLYYAVLEDGSLGEIDYDLYPDIVNRINGKNYIYYNEKEKAYWDGNILAGTYKAQSPNFSDKLSFKIAVSATEAIDVFGNDFNEKQPNIYAGAFDLAVDSLLPTIVAKNLKDDGAYHKTNEWAYILAGSWEKISTVEDLIRLSFNDPDVLGKAEGFPMYMRFTGNNNFQLNDTEHGTISIPGCGIEACESEPYFTQVKTSSNDEIKFTGYVLGKPHPFAVMDNSYIPIIDSLSFVSATDSMVVIQSDRNNRVVSMDIIAPTDIYKLPNLGTELNLTLRLSSVADSRHKLNVDVPNSEGTLFRTIEMPSTYFVASELELPKLATLNSCNVSYELLNEDSSVNKFADIKQNENGNFTWSVGATSREATIRAVVQDGQCDKTPRTVEIEVEDANLDLFHFGEKLAKTTRNGRTFYEFPNNGNWPVTVEVTPKSGYKVDSIMFEGKLVEAKKPFMISTNGKIVVSTTQDMLSDTEVYNIASAYTTLSGNAMRVTVNTADFDTENPVIVTARLFTNGKPYSKVDTLSTSAKGNSTYTWKYFNLEPGEYFAEVTLSGKYKDVHDTTDIKTIEESLNIVKAGSWGMKSLANVSDDFKIPESDEGAIYCWDETNAIGDFMQYKKVRDAKDLKPTVGYWYVSSEESDLKRTPSDTTEKELSWNLKNKFSGWNLVANPYSWNLSLGETGDIDDPEDDRDVYMRWNPETLSYDTASTIGAYEGMWIHTESDHEMVLNTEPVFEESIEKDTNAGKKQRALNKTSVSKSSWSLRLILAGEKGLTDALNVVGVGSKNIEVLDPPAAMEGGVNLAIESGNRSLAKSIRNSLDEASWNLNLSAASLQKGKLSIKGIDQLTSAGLYAALVMDGKVIPLTAGEDVPVNLSTVAKTAVLKVSASPSIQLALGVSGLQFKSAGNQLMVNFNLGEVAASKVEIRLVDARGNVVSSANENAFAGSHSVALEKPAATGVYILRVNAGKNGTQMKIRL